MHAPSLHPNPPARLLIALDDYLSNPSQECLGAFFDAVNSIDLFGAPILTRNDSEKIATAFSEDRKEIFVSGPQNGGGARTYVARKRAAVRKGRDAPSVDAVGGVVLQLWTTETAPTLRVPYNPNAPPPAETLGTTSVRHRRRCVQPERSSTDTSSGPSHNHLKPPLVV
ncbi:UDENN domain-containing protein [Mycena kentingensis (nom. inval.)]|nr:UDENN domain-containing protein [Mycena kentingensis (nom. inval.)]